ncbi:tRNA pseudouridine synthase Pus10 [Candidatus Anstonella stagnisolia]|nr:tRNA pseudouridine synthase Pus10 [Candidatus Anstonella stagnisolia]
MLTHINADTGKKGIGNMEKTGICKFCAAAHEKILRVADEKCFLCRGVFAKMGQLLDEAILQSKGFEWETFAVSSSMQREIFAREEELFDVCAPEKCMCIKNVVNRAAAAEIEKRTGKKMDAKNPDALFSVDFLKGKGSASAAPLYLFGHYCKFSRSMAQSSWGCNECNGSGKARGALCAKCNGTGRMYVAIEDVMREAAKKVFGATDASLHASGREDVDVCMKGSGRPFVLEVISPKKRRGNFEKELNAGKEIKVGGVKATNKNAIEIVCTSHFEKEYDMLVDLQRDALESDVEKMQKMFSGGFVELVQQTPTRVLHRRSDLARKRNVYLLGAKVEGGLLRVHLKTDAGTYVKEFASSDEGRTKPSIALVLGCKAACRQLDVIKIHDEFLKTVI